MKKRFAVLTFSLLFALAPGASFASNEIIIEVVVHLQVRPIAHLDAQYVMVKVLDANGNMLTAGQVVPGEDIYFDRSGNERQVLEIYHMASGAEYIIISDIMP